MRTSRLAAATILAALLSASAAAAQDTPTGVQPYRFTVEGYLAQYWLDNGVDDREAVGGFGARIMFHRSTAAAAARTFFSRATAGVYGTFTSQDNVSTQNIGAQVDAALFPSAIAAGRLDPFVSLGAGAFRTKVEGFDGETNFVLTPAVGTRIPITGGVGFRGDIRAPIIFGDDTRLQWLAEGGVYISF